MTDPADLVVDRYTDALGRDTPTDPGVRRAVLAAMGLEDAAANPADARNGVPEPVRLGAPGQALDGPAELVLEDGTSAGTLGRLPADLPHGYHRLRRDAGEQLLLVAPRRCVQLPDPPGWAWAAQLPAVRSRASWGIGDLGDLRSLAAWSAGLGAAAIVVSPLVAPNPDPNPEPSPYYPSTRRFRNPLLLRIEEIEGAAHLAGLAPLAAKARDLNVRPLIDRARVAQLKGEALELLWRARARDAEEPALAVYRTEQGTALRDWAVFAAIAERHPGGWRAWPEELRHPRSAAVAEFARAHAERIAFHEWVQWLLDEQLRRAAAAGPRIVTDLPIGFDPGGFDAWEWQEVLSPSASVGAPPDRFNPAGQDWGLPPFVPHRLREAHLAPFIETVRAAMRHAGGLRIDHVLGLFRLWWIPHAARGGAYVRYPADELLAVLAIESERANAVVIGEDLGTVERGVRRSLAGRGLLSTRLAYFEERGLAAIPRRVFAAVTTHDLPTVAGAWSGADLDDMAAAGVPPDRNGLAILRRRIAKAGGLHDNATEREAILAVYAALAASPAILVGATLEDALAVTERPNLPGTVAGQRPNWSLALPKPLEALEHDPFVRQLAATLGRRGGRAS